MTREEIQAEISRLKIEVHKLNTSLKEYEEGLRWAIKEDAKETKKLFGRHSRGPIGTAIEHADLQRETRFRKSIREEQNKRIELLTRIEELKAQLSAISKPAQPDKSARMTGVVKRYFSEAEKGFGFIEVAGQPSIFVHKSKLMESTALQKGDKVTFKCLKGPKGLKAVDVRYFVEDEEKPSQD